MNLAWLIPLSQFCRIRGKQNMSGYRPIYKRIWKDPDFQELSAEDKLLFIYLCTNEMTSESGIYPVTAKTIIYETGLDDKTVVQRLSNG